MSKTGLLKKGPTTPQSEIRAVKVAFAQAPVNAGGTINPDGQPGINLWIDTGGLTDPNGIEDTGGAGSCSDGMDNGGDGLVDSADPSCLAGDNFGGGNSMFLEVDEICGVGDSDFYEAKNNFFNRVDRYLIFHYAITAQMCDENDDGIGDSGGQAEKGGNDFVDFNHDGGTIMHELGHNLNLGHGGFEDDNCKPNYVSIMNYDHDVIYQNGGSAIIDFSPPRFPGGRGAAALPVLVENNLNDGIILDPSDPKNQFIFVSPDGKKVRIPLNMPVDWNLDKDIVDLDLTQNIDTVAEPPARYARFASIPTVIVNVALCWLSNSPSEHVSVPAGDSTHSPVSLTYDTPPGRTSVTAILLAGLGPSFVTVIVYCNSSPATAGSSLSLSVTSIITSAVLSSCRNCSFCSSVGSGPITGFIALSKESPNCLNGITILLQSSDPVNVSLLEPFSQAGSTPPEVSIF